MVEKHTGRCNTYSTHTLPFQFHFLTSTAVAVCVCVCVRAVMAPKPRTFHPVKLGRSLTISGGHTPGKQHVLHTQEFTFTRGHGDAAGVEVKKECVLIFSKAAWLCEMATGQAVYQRPLTRVNILNEIRQRVINNEDSAADGKMAALAFDDDEGDDEKLETPKKRKRGKEESTETPAVAGAAICQRIQVPQSWRDKSKCAIYVALDSKRRLWLDIEALPWFIQYVKDEKESGGVAPVEKAIRGGREQDSASAVAETFRIYWNFRDDGWIARAQTPSGSWLQASRGVKRRQKTDRVDFETAKKVVYTEMEAWVEAVRAGEVTADEEPVIRDGGD